jgi:uncharacterized protein
MNATAMWKALAWPGLEHLVIRTTGEAIEADGIVIALDGRPLRIHYRLRLAPDWTTRRLVLDELESGTTMTFVGDGAGHWTDEQDRVIDGLAGCVDVDIGATPFTNTLPTRRLDWRAGQVRDLRVLYVQVPELTVRAADQRYTCLALDEGGGTYRFESDSFTTEIRVDRDGLVLEYPDLWRRVWPEVVA